MQRITLKDNHFKIIGYVDVDDKGNKTLRDDHFRIKGYYQVSGNATKDDHFRIVGYGDILTTLL